MKKRAAGTSSGSWVEMLLVAGGGGRDRSGGAAGAGRGGGDNTEQHMASDMTGGVRCMG
jgi:hypothetical protein